MRHGLGIESLTHPGSDALVLSTACTSHCLSVLVSNDILHSTCTCEPATKGAFPQHCSLLDKRNCRFQLTNQERSLVPHTSFVRRYTVSSGKREQESTMSVIGVDFGNDTCVIGMAARGGIDIILNENSNRKNPTLVSSPWTGRGLVL